MFQIIRMGLLAACLFSGQAASGVDWSGAELQHEIELEAAISQLAFSSDGEWLAGTDESTLKVWEVASGQLVHRLEDQPVPWPPRVDGMRFSPGPAEVDSAALALPLPRQGPAHALAMSGQGRHLAWVGKPPTYPSPVLRIWHVAADSQPEYQILELPAETTTEHPVALAHRHYGLRELNPVTTEHIEQRMLETGAVQVTLTLKDLKDDSIRALRYRLTFEPGQAKGWELIRVERKQQCRRGPTARDQWTGALCL